MPEFADKLTRRTLTILFFVMLLMGFVCLSGAALYLYRFQSQLSDIPSTITQAQTASGPAAKSLPEQEVTALAVSYERRIELLSTGVFVGLAFGFLGFALIVIGVRGDISAEGAQGPLSLKFAHLSPGVLVIIAATTLVAICTTRSLPLGFNSGGGTSAPRINLPQVLTPASEEAPKNTEKRNNNTSVANSTDPWAAIDDAAVKCFALLNEEANAILPEDQHQLWTKRTAAFRHLELALDDWIRTDEGQKILREGGTAALKLTFRRGLYAEYADDYNQARDYFNECLHDKNLKDPKATWNGKPLSSLVTSHYSRCDTAVYSAISLLGNSSQLPTQTRNLDSSVVVQEYFVGSIAQSAAGPRERQEKTYQGILAILDEKDKEWARRDSNASAIKFHADPSELKNDSERHP
jgi:hypothetical protein